MSKSKGFRNRNFNCDYVDKMKRCSTFDLQTNRLIGESLVRWYLVFEKI